MWVGVLATSGGIATITHGLNAVMVSTSIRFPPENLTLQREFCLFWRVVILHLHPVCDRSDQVILTCHTNHERCLCDMNQGLMP